MLKKNCWLAILCALFCGVLIGGILVYLFKPNHFRVHVRASKKVYLIARKGDIIQWVPDLGQTIAPSVSLVNVPGTVPFCVETSDKLSLCTVNVSKGHYSYTCNDPPCADPGVGGGGSVIGGLTGLTDALGFLFATLPAKIFHFTRESAPFSGTSSRGDYPPQVHCPAGTTKVDPDPIVAATGSIIQWEDGVDELTVRPPAGMCYGDPAAIDAAHACTVTGASGKTYTYKVEMPKCTQGEATLRVP